MRSEAIKAFMAEHGCTAKETTRRGTGDSRAICYRLSGGDLADPVAVAETNGDPVWQDDDPEGFAALMAQD